MSINKPPLLLFAFANDQDSYLENLKTEEREIRNILRPLHDSSKIEFLSIGHTDKDDIFKSFEKYSDRIAVFHYGGHAGGTQLHLEDDVASAKGLAGLFGTASKMQLVFLNGCSSAGQVDRLFKAGVKSVIATSAPIDDTKATEFAIEFYRTLAEGRDIETCFKTAIAYLQTSAKLKDKDLSSTIDNKKPEEPLWGLYVKSKSSLGWRVFDKPEPISKEEIPAKPVNEFLMTVVFDAVNSIIPFSGGAIKNPAQLKLKKKEHLITSFPSVIGVLISYLFTPELSEKNQERFKQIKETYLRVLRFLSAVFVSDAWEEIERNPNFKVSNELRFLLNSYIELTEKEANSFDYLLLIDTIRKSFEENSSPFFLPDLKESFQTLESKGDLYKSGLFFKEILSLYGETEPDKAGIEKLCNDGEYYLSILLKQIAFISQYYLSSNKKIFIHKPRFQKEVFQHELRVLYGADFSEDEEMGKRQDFLSNHSVYLVQQTEDKSLFLNLSPFLIDENAFRDINTPDLQLYTFKDRNKFFYDHTAENELNCKYELSEEIVSKLSEEEFRVKEFYNETLGLFSSFKKRINGEAGNE